MTGVPVLPPSFPMLIDQLLASGPGDSAAWSVLSGGIGAAPNGEYSHWETFRRLSPPAPLTPDQYWTAVKLARRSISHPLPLLDKDGQPFTWCVPTVVQEFLHKVDRDLAVSIGAAAPVTNPDTRNTYLLRSIIEEAITSSQLEGASTTRRVAKDMLLAGREPRDRSERMILNNYRAMQFVAAHKTDAITSSHVLELQRILTEHAIDDPSAAGRFRREDEDIVVSDVQTGELLHRPPAASELRERLDRLVAFANGKTVGEFLHPAIRAILVHFMIGYDHPFVDGNGRTARALFYWVMAREGYWLCEFVSISSILKNARAQYGRSYLFTETDDNDTTYFVLYQLRTLVRAIDALYGYLKRKEAEWQRIAEATRAGKQLQDVLNKRQLALLGHALRHADGEYTILSHKTAHDVSWATSRNDLQDLLRRKLLRRTKRGRMDVFVPAPNLADMIRLPSHPAHS